MPQKLAVFSDLDGCLLDKATYSFAPALPTIERLKQLGIPLILASSKTEAEMIPLASAMELDEAPLICENGGCVRWSNQGGQAERIVLGEPRVRILDVLKGLKNEFKFRSFVDLGVGGVAECTQLPVEKAELAVQRESTEPLLWDDEQSRLSGFQAAIEAAGLSLTRGGRFWHIAGATTKGKGMQAVLDRSYPATDSVAIGDSPIDQSLLDIAEHPIGIPQPDGQVLVTVHSGGRIASQPGPAGWAAEVGAVLDALKL
ncbi:MAG: mannosyl-3-phosphoglycerate phosphatase-related protein [Aureliella sp.]